MKTLVAHEQPIAKLFSNDYVFNIPGYQRPYAWTTEQARELLEDLAAAMQEDDSPVEEMSPYFLGSIVLIKADAIPQADVVDGQQRLTTLTLLLAAIRGLVNPQYASEITPLLYEKGAAIFGTVDRFRLSLRERDREFFQQYVQREGGLQDLLSLSTPLSDSQANILNNARLFHERLSRLPENELLTLARFVVTRCYLVVVATPDLDSAYRIFSVLNSRGLDLSATDILKAEIIGGIPPAQRDAYTKRWEDAEEDLGRDAFADMFSHIRMIYRKAKPKGTLLREFKDHVTEIQTPAKFIDSVLQPMATAYGEIRDSAYQSTAYAEQVNESLKWLNRLEFTDWMPPALTFMVRFRNMPEKLRDFFRDLERVAYAMLIARWGINPRIERFSRITSVIETNPGGLQDPISPLQLTPAEQHQVYRALDGPVYENYAARARTAILLRLDALLSAGGATYDYQTISVEHVLPQTPALGSQWLEWCPDPEERLFWVHRLGNLGLLTRRKNSAASNYEFGVKKSTYFSKGGVSPFVLTTQVLSEDQWTIAVIKRRQADLLRTLETHWRLESRQP